MFWLSSFVPHGTDLVTFRFGVNMHDPPESSLPLCRFFLFQTQAHRLNSAVQTQNVLCRYCICSARHVEACAQTTKVKLNKPPRRFDHARNCAYHRCESWHRFRDSKGAGCCGLSCL